MDCHAHLTRFWNAAELHLILKRAWRHGLRQILAVSVNLEDAVPLRQLAANQCGKIHYTVGIHPTELGDFPLHDLFSALFSLAKPTGPAPVAIGEIGLDYHHLPPNDASVRRRQWEFFASQLDVARRLELPVVLHCRDSDNERYAWNDCNAILREVNFPFSRAAMHCFSYGANEMRQWNGAGAVASFTGTLTFEKADSIREAFQAQPLDRVMFETDCPFLMPDPRRKKAEILKNEPIFVLDTIAFAAKLVGMDPRALAQKALENGCRFFGISPL